MWEGPFQFAKLFSIFVIPTLTFIIMRVGDMKFNSYSYAADPYMGIHTKDSN